MKKFLVSVDEKLYYLAKEISAKNKQEAMKIYMKMWEDGDVEVNDSQQYPIKVKLIR